MSEYRIKSDGMVIFGSNSATETMHYFGMYHDSVEMIFQKKEPGGRWKKVTMTVVLDDREEETRHDRQHD